MSVDVEEIEFEEYLSLKKRGSDPDSRPGITVGPARWSSIYINKKATELMEIHNRDQFAAAPNPDNPDGNEFFLCKTTDGDGWTFNTEHGPGATVTRGLVAKLGEQFDAKLKYEIKETGMAHPEWETPIFLAVPWNQDAEV